MLTPNEIDSIKKQIVEQIERTFPLDRKESAKKQILSMPDQDFENFLIKNNLIRDIDGSGQETNTHEIQTPLAKAQTQQCIFCSIANNEINSVKLLEGKNEIAVLEINPISKAHSLVIPKKHIDSDEEIPSTSFSLAKKIAKAIKTKYKSKNTIISTSNLLGHSIIQIIPVYKNETLNSERSRSNLEDLESIKRDLDINNKIKEPKPRKAKPIKAQSQKSKSKQLEENKLPRRIP